jgi:hypothetical protein
VDADELIPLGDAVQLLHSGTGRSFKLNYFGEKERLTGNTARNDSGTVDTVMTQFHLRIADLLHDPFGGRDPSQPFGMGGIVSKPTLGLFGEAGPEVVIPLSKPARAQQLMEEAGLTSKTQGSAVVSIGTATFVTPTDLDLLFQKAEAAMVLTGAL